MPPRPASSMAIALTRKTSSMTQPACPTKRLPARSSVPAIDLLVDLNGYSAMARLPLFTMRPAPVVVGWFNMYATTGITGYDYLIGDDLVIPPEEETFYCEKILRVPGSYLTFEVTYPVPRVSDPPCLTNQAITFGCLASQYKITNEVIAAWSNVLQQVPNSTLLLKNAALGSPGVREFVHGLFELHHISPERVHLEGPSDHYEFLETYGRDRHRPRHIPLQRRHNHHGGDLAGRPRGRFFRRSLGCPNQRLHPADRRPRRTCRPNARRLHLARREPGEFPGSSVRPSPKHAIPAPCLSRLRHRNLRPEHGEPVHA